MSAFHDNALIGASGSQGYQISRSVRLRSSASAYFSRTLTTPSNPKKWTFSAWVKGSFYNGTNYTHLFGTGAGANDTSSNQFIWSGTNSNLAFTLWSINVLITNAVYRDPSAWYHVMLVMDNANATASNRAKIYVNGVEPTYSTDNRASLSTTTNYAINSAILHTIGRWAYNSFVQPEQLDAYITEVNFIDGEALTPISFGETNPVTGVWQPKKYTGTYGTNGFYLNFSDNSAATAAAIGKDYSGNGNNWTPNNISVTAGVTYDSMLDVPTQWADGGNGRGNYCTFNPLKSNSSTTTFSEANLKATFPNAGAGGVAMGSMAVNSGKWYWEVTVGGTDGSTQPKLGVLSPTVLTETSSSTDVATLGYAYSRNGTKWIVGSNSSYGSAFTTNDVIGFALDMDAGTLVCYLNNTSQGTLASGLTGLLSPAMTGYTGITLFANFGQRPFAYTPPSGFKALNTLNLPTPTIANGANYFAATTYTGTGASRSVDNTVNNVSFQPDFVWVKGRSGATDHALYDAVRGVQLQLESNTTTAETTETTGLTAFNSNGFTVGALAQMNTNTATYVAWQWKEGATQGFDIVLYTGNSTNRTIAHNLGVAPRMIILKSRTSGTAQWVVYHGSLSNTQALYLNATSSAATSALFWNSTSPTSSVFSLGTSSDVNVTAQDYVAYLFAEVAGFSRFGSYTGNGSADGPFVFCGFRPRFVLIKESSAAGNNWVIYDTARDTYNECSNILYPNLSNAEFSGSTVNLDILSNGFKPRDNWGGNNTNGSTYIYAAFAENPTKYALAR